MNIRLQKNNGISGKNRDKPWCVTASLVGPHFPNSNPEPFYIMYDQVDIPMPKSMYDTFQNKPWYQSRKWWPSIDTEYFDEHEWEKLFALIMAQSV